MTQVRLIGGPFHWLAADLSKMPPRITVAGHVYVAVDDPDTGQFLGGYAYDGGAVA